MASDSYPIFHSLLQRTGWPALRLLDRQANMKCGAASDFTLEINRAIVRFFDDLFRNRQAQSGADSNRLRSKTARKDPVPVFGTDTMSRIRDGNLDEITRPARAHDDFALTLDSLPGIHQNIQKHLVQHV